MDQKRDEDMSLLRKCPLRFMSYEAVNWDDIGCINIRCMWYVRWVHSGDCAIPRLVEVLHPETTHDFLSRTENNRNRKDK